MRKKQPNGFSLVEIVAALVVLILATALVVPRFMSYRENTEKKLHVINTLTLMQAAQDAIQRGDIEAPQPGETQQVSLAELQAINPNLKIKNPSSQDQEYSPTSRIEVSNTNTVINYYIDLESKDAETKYINTTSSSPQAFSKPIPKLKAKDIELKE
jgi:type II secretory pathway pseudopilin PulG